MTKFTILFALAAFLVSCDSFLPDKGHLGQPCTTGGLCVDGLICLDGNCVNPNTPDGDADNPTDGDQDTVDGDLPTDGDIDNPPDGDKDTTDGDTDNPPDGDKDTTDGDTDNPPDGDMDTIDGDLPSDGDAVDGDAPVDGDEPVDGDVPADGDEDVVEFGLTWISIPSGNYQQGCVPQDTNCNSNESPRHSVTVDAFEMTATEITQAQYEAVTGSNPSYNGDCSTCPVEQVDWYDAKAFCEAVGGRLPSEAEWEYAARAGTTTTWLCGDTSSSLDDIACWYQAESCPVGGHDANAFGLYDMSGNVWEWVEDCYHSDYNGHPGTGDVWEGGDCSYRVLRGGDCFDFNNLRASLRYYYDPVMTLNGSGFRCSRDLN